MTYSTSHREQPAAATTGWARAATASVTFAIIITSFCDSKWGPLRRSLPCSGIRRFGVVTPRPPHGRVAFPPSRTRNRRPSALVSPPRSGPSSPARGFGASQLKRAEFQPHSCLHYHDSVYTIPYSPADCKGADEVFSKKSGPFQNFFQKVRRKKPNLPLIPGRGGKKPGHTIWRMGLPSLQPQT